jgi:hypothetical protein
LEINTSASIRNKAMLEGLLENDHTVDLVSTVPNPQHVAYDESLSVSGVHTIRVSINNAQRLAGMRVKGKLFQQLKSMAYKWISKHKVYDHLKSIASHTDCIDLSASNYDYIISSSDPKSSHLFVFKLLEQQQRSFHGEWIQIWGDPFLADITRTNRNKRIIKAEEQRLLQASDCVFYVSMMTLEQQKRLYPDCACKMRFTPIPYVQENITENRKLDNAFPVELAYCGDYNTSIRNLAPLYDTVNNSNKLHLVICGSSDSPLRSTRYVNVIGRVSFHVTREVEDNADILVFVANKTGAQIPGKIYQYAGTNKPVLFILDGNVDELKAQFEQYDRFVFVNNSCKSIQQGIASIVHSGVIYSPLKEFSKKNIMTAFMQEVSIKM